MSFADKVQNKTDELKGTAKEKLGDLTDNKRLQAEGSTERSEARTRQAGEHAKAAGQEARDAFRG